MTGTSNNGTITYTYDNRGNRLTQTRDGITVSYTYDLNNRLTTSTANGVTGYTYDASGNTLSVMGTSGSATYTYDLFNRQKTHTSGGVVTTTTYRPDGLRHSIGNTKHIWDGQNIVGEYVGTAYKKYFRALTLIYRLASNTKQWYNTNGHGDVIALTNATGTVVKTYTYNAFGEEQDISTTDGNPFRYCGEYYDTACGTLYLRARNYNASIGRFTQEDPIRDGGNWYSYCGSNPVNAHDPSGLSFWYYDEEGNKVEDYTRRPVIAKIEPISVKDNNYKKIEITGKRTMEPQKGTGISYYFNAMRGTKSFFGYNIAIDTYKHSLFGNGKDLNYYNNSMMAYELRASSKMQDLIDKKIDEYILTGKTEFIEKNFDFYGSDDFFDKDLAYSIGGINGHIKINISETTETTGFWFFEETKEYYVVEIELTDYYDFHDKGSPAYGDFAKMVNQYLGYYPQEAGIVTPYNLKVNYTVYYKKG